MLNQFVVQWLPGMTNLAQAHRLAGQQHDNLCGTYWGAIFLRSRNHLYTPEQIAQIAGTVLPRCEASDCIPTGAVSRQDYHVSLPMTDQIEQSGTSVLGLIKAIDQLSNSDYCLIPVQAKWSSDQVDAVLSLCLNNSDWNLVPLCNIRTAHLWGAQLPVSDAIAYLSGASISPPAADWNVGHFLVLAGTVTGTERRLILACDTYPMFGWQGYHLQSIDAIAAALDRGDGNQGGILLFADVQHKTAIEQELRQQQFTIEPWDNGSPVPQ